MKHRIICKAIACILVFCLVVPVFASNTPVEPDIGSFNHVFSDGVATVTNNNNYVLVTIDRKTTHPYKKSARHYNASTEFTEYREQIITAYVPNTDVESEELFNSLSANLINTIERGSSTIEGRDSAYCAYFTLTVNYTRELVDDYWYYSIDSVSGGYSDPTYTTGNYVGENVYVTALAVDIYQNGFVENIGHISNQVYSPPLSPMNRSWTSYVPIGWLPVCSLATGALVGATYYFTLTRGGSSWTSQIVLTVHDVSPI